MSDLWKDRETPLIILRDESYPIDALAGGLALLGAGLGAPLGGSERTCVHHPRPELTYIDTPKPLSKRRARRLRGKGQP